MAVSFISTAAGRKRWVTEENAAARTKDDPLKLADDNNIIAFNKKACKQRFHIKKDVYSEAAEMKELEIGSRHKIKELASNLKFELLKWLIRLARSAD